MIKSRGWVKLCWNEFLVETYDKWWHEKTNKWKQVGEGLDSVGMNFVIKAYDKNIIRLVDGSNYVGMNFFVKLTSKKWIQIGV